MTVEHEWGSVVEEAAASDDRRGTRIRSVSRAAELLMLIASLPEQERSVSKLAAALGTSVPTIYHLLNTLVDAKLLARDERKQYRFGLAVGVLSAAYAQQTVPPPELLAPLRKIIEDTGESAYLSVWRNGSPVMLAHLAGTHAVQVTNLHPGFQGAANARASGKVLLAFAEPAERKRYLAIHPLQRRTPRTITEPEVFERELRQVSEDGYATEVEEFAVGVACISVPVWSSGILIGAYTISAPVHRCQENKEHYLACLREAAALLAVGE
ncbi:IclR family transcriptional regulator [Saccharopolyspora sp. 5N708]|uniref:IclR family transcriptional regulator n=1 Tax=Saccharopolyspora sp. 5N708 TaxID=3457424 RepID=UPI003FD1F69B